MLRIPIRVEDVGEEKGEQVTVGGYIWLRRGKKQVPTHPSEHLWCGAALYRSSAGGRSAAVGMHMNGGCVHFYRGFRFNEVAKGEPPRLRLLT